MVIKPLLFFYFQDDYQYEQMDVTGSLQIQRITKCVDQVVLVWVSTSWSFLEESRDPSTHCNSTDSFAKQCNYRVNCQVELEQVREEQRENNCDRHRAFVFVTCLNGKNFLSTPPPPLY